MWKYEISLASGTRELCSRYHKGAEEVKDSPETNDIEETEEAEDAEIPENHKELQDNDLTQYSCGYFGFPCIYKENLFKVTSDD